MSFIPQSSWSYALHQTPVEGVPKSQHTQTNLDNVCMQYNQTLYTVYSAYLQKVSSNGS